MASFSATFKAERDKKGPGKTFTWTDKNGKTETYSTDYAEEKKSAPATKPKAKPAPTKPKARPANLNPQSGAAQSGTAGKVKPKTKPSGFNDPDSGYTYQHLPGKGRDSSKASSAMSGASRSTANKVAPEATFKLPEWLYFVKKGDLQKFKDILDGGGLSNYAKKK